jgi:hypothetical protein
MGQQPLVPLLLLGPPLLFPIILFGSATLKTGDDRHLLAHAMASDYSVAWLKSKFLSKTFYFL